MSLIVPPAGPVPLLDIAVRQTGIVILDASDSVNATLTELIRDKKTILNRFFTRGHLRPFCGFRITRETSTQGFLLAYRFELFKDNQVFWYPVFGVTEIRRGVYLYPARAFNLARVSNPGGFWRLVVSVSEVAEEALPDAYATELLSDFLKRLPFREVDRFSWRVTNGTIELLPDGARVRPRSTDADDAGISADDL